MNADVLADILEELINIPSETGHEGPIADWMARRLHGVRWGGVERTGNAVVWRRRDAGDAPLLVLAGHLDTVPARGNARARREGGSIHGLGATDMKGGDAVILGLIEGLDPTSLRFDLAAVFYDAEEGPAEGNGLKRVLRDMPWLTRARLAILLEPTDLRVEVGCNGALNAQVRVFGRAAHSARPWLGVNAIERAAPWLDKITRFEPKPVSIDGATFVETLQVTVLEAGRTRNVVPDTLTANLNYRFPPDVTPEEAERRVRALVPPAFETRIVDSAPPGAVHAADPEVRAFIERFDLEVEGKQGWTDVARFTAAGIPAVNYGPGIPELSHRPDEHCPIENLVVACDRLRQFVTAEAS